MQYAIMAFLLRQNLSSLFHMDDKSSIGNLYQWNSPLIMLFFKQIFLFLNTTTPNVCATLLSRTFIRFVKRWKSRGILSNARQSFVVLLTIPSSKMYTRNIQEMLFLTCYIYYRTLPRLTFCRQGGRKYILILKIRAKWLYLLDHWCFKL